MFYRIACMGSYAQNMNAEDDGLCCPEVGSWAEEKYRLLALYDELFSTGMKYKWDQRVYVDLYAGARICRVKGYEEDSQRVSHPAPWRHASVRQVYILRRKPRLAGGAEGPRRRGLAPQAHVAYVPADCDSKSAEICKEIPKGSQSNKVLSLCLVDPFDFGLKFETIKKLSGVLYRFRGAARDRHGCEPKL